MQDKQNKFFDVQNTVLFDNDPKNFTIKHSQHIPQSFLENIRNQRDNSLNQNEGEFMRVASVPVAVHEQWLREGFDMMQETPKAILTRLKQQNLDAFITTKKQV
jgi:predicted HTH transcriptional regulator